MVGKAIGHGNPWRLESSQRVPDFQVALTSDNLTRIAPRRSGIRDVRIIHPFGGLMGDDRSIVRRRNEKSANVEVERGIRLQTSIRDGGGMVSAGAAVGE